MHFINEFLSDEEGQGTTEYAIIVGLLVVVAIGAILVVSGKVGPLWESIKTGFQQLPQ